MIQPIELYEYAPSPLRPDYKEVAGGRFLKDVLSELRQRLDADVTLAMDRLEYFGLDAVNAMATWPRHTRRIVCFAATGGSEGHYVHVGILYLDFGDSEPKYQHLFLGKTFHGLEHAQRIANACAVHLGA
jgi:hypothetical protein